MAMTSRASQAEQLEVAFLEAAGSEMGGCLHRKSL